LALVIINGSYDPKKTGNLLGIAASTRAGANAMKEMLGIKGKLALIVMALGLAIGGVGWAPSNGLAENIQSVNRVAGIPATNGPTLAVDQYGDQLPEGAVARLGVRRFRHDGQANWLAFTADGKTLFKQRASRIP
jgi:hypothetical protein